MNFHEQAATLFIKAQNLGMDAPSEGMVAEAIHNAECNALNFPHRVNALGRHSDFIVEVRNAVGHLAERVALDMDHKNKDHKKWYKAVQAVRKYLQMSVE